MSLLVDIRTLESAKELLLIYKQALNSERNKLADNSLFKDHYDIKILKIDQVVDKIDKTIKQ